MGRVHIGQEALFLNSREKSISSRDGRVGYVNQRFTQAVQEQLAEGSNTYRNVYDAACLSDGSIVFTGDLGLNLNLKDGRSLAYPIVISSKYEISNITTVDANGYALHVAVDSSDRIILSGSSLPIITRYSSSGVADVSFNENIAAAGGLGDMSVTSIAVDASGGVFVAGIGAFGVNFARVHSNGVGDSTFTNRFATAANCTAIYVSSLDGSIFVAGNFTTVDVLDPVNGVAKFHANGMWDGSFVPSLNASYLSNIVRDESTGKVYVSGSFDSLSGDSRSGIARFHPNGALDTSFDAELAPSNNIPYTNVQGIRPLGDGRVIISGSNLAINGSLTTVAVLEEDGSSSGEFDPQVVGIDSVGEIVYDLLPLPNGRYAMYGYALLEADRIPISAGIAEMWNKNT